MFLFPSVSGASLPSPCAIKESNSAYTFYDKGTTCGSGSGVKMTCSIDNQQKIVFNGRSGSTSYSMASPSATSAKIKITTQNETSSTGYSTRSVTSVVMTKKELEAAKSENEKEKETVKNSVGGAIHEGFGTSLDPIRKKHNEDCVRKYGSSGNKSNECMASFSDSVVRCTNKSRSDVNASEKMTVQSGGEKRSI